MQKRKILVIEDHPLVRDIILEMLLAEGYDVQGAPDGRAGLELINSRLPDLVLSDYYMPETNGLQVLSRLRAMPHTAMIPFVLMSIDESGSLRERSLKAGADAFVAKGCDDAKLLDTIRNVLARLNTHENSKPVA